MKPYFFALLLIFSFSFKSTVAQKKEKSAKRTEISNNFEKGVIEDGYKTGIWQYYDKPGILSLKVDYTSGEILFMKNDTDGLYAIESGDGWVRSRLDHQPRYIGSMGEFYTILMRNIRFPDQARNKKTAGTIYVTFDVDTTGKANNFTIAKNIGGNCAEEVIRVLQLVPNFWTVASKDGKLHNSRFMLPVTFKRASGVEDQPGSNPELPLATLLDEVVISIHYSIRQR